MARKIIIGIALIILGIMGAIYYPDVAYHLNYDQIEALPNLALEDVLKSPEYISGIEKAVGSTKIWGDMSKKQKEKWVDKCNVKSFLIFGVFLTVAIIQFNIPVKKKIADGKKDGKKND